MPKRTIVTLVVFAIVGAALFFLYPRSSFDPATDASNKINQQIWDELGRDSEVDCTAPETSVVGAAFRCRAMVDDGTTLDFDVTIVDGPAVVTDLDI